MLQFQVDIKSIGKNEGWLSHPPKNEQLDTKIIGNKKGTKIIGNKKDDDGTRGREGLVPRLRVIFRRLVSTGVA